MSDARGPYDDLTRDPEAEAETAAHAAKVKRQQEVDDLKWLMAHAPGRRFAARLLDQSAVSRTSFHTSGSVMALNEGRKQLGYWLQAELLTVTPDAYLKMLKEFSNG